jgi:molybdenum transport protein
MLGADCWSGAIRLSDSEIEQLLDDDIRFGDLTTRALGIADFQGSMSFKPRRDMVLCGVDEAARLLSMLGAEVVFQSRSGSQIRAGELVLEAQGSAAALHAGWKIAQTLMEWASGVATATAEIVAAARVVVPDIAVSVTRKSVPYTRKLALKAAFAGGGEVHRFGLSDTVMLFSEHRGFSRVFEDLATTIGRLKRRLPERMIMVEVTSEAEARAAVTADVIQLEKFTPEAALSVMLSIRKREDGRPVIAAAGGINAANAAQYAQSGVDTLVTSAPFYAKPIDIQVHIEPS